MLRKDIKRLKALTREITKGLDMLMSDKYAIMHKSNMSSSDIFTASYSPGERYCKITKEIGNELVPMFTAIRQIDEIINRS